MAASSELFELIALDQDHPGFRDADYRSRRDAIAQIALTFAPGRPLRDVAYVDVEHDVWRQVRARLRSAHDQFACRFYLEAVEAFDLPESEVPQFSTINHKLAQRSGYAMWPVAGLVKPRTFMEKLGDRVFLATQYIRHHSQPFYTPEPDVIHELIGHAPTLATTDFVQLGEAFGRATERAGDTEIEGLIRLYWYTLEFGLVEEGGRPRALGAGLLSSYGELERLGTGDVRLLEWDIERIEQTPFDPTQYQANLFVAPSYRQMVDGLLRRLDR